ncbi:single-stranded DNA-binding protein [Nocardia higoensis]|uniref:Single-stranded DNA-binding protein n=1 Tax=Nocardia higoensis TaxID=228599 RepID=A0ABS0DJ14_9NOCA|nr:single-stranded DNA-binding protein [Nocardia higoensis]MBF6358450.1 single-stranded DNA-binding protein [Nocardia higoensis]
MSEGKIPMTITGNLTADPELRFTPNGVAVANFTVASTPRVYDKATNQWKDGETLFMRCVVWREMAENITESLTKGARVVVTGILRQRNWTDDNDQKRTTYELDAEEVAASMRFAQLTIKRIARDRNAA